MRYRIVWITGTALALSACAAGPDYRAPQPAALGIPATYDQGSGAPISDADLAQWWTRLNDPALSTLIDTAVTANLDIVQAQARFRQARESLVQANASFLPQLSGSASGGKNYRSQAGGTRTDGWKRGDVCSAAAIRTACRFAIDRVAHRVLDKSRSGGGWG